MINGHEIGSKGNKYINWFMYCKAHIEWVVNSSSIGNQNHEYFLHYDQRSLISLVLTLYGPMDSKVIFQPMLFLPDNNIKKAL